MFEYDRRQAVLLARVLTAKRSTSGIEERAMGLTEDVASRAGIIASMEDVALKQFLFLRNLADPVIARFGERGMKALDAAFRHYGQWRGDNIRMNQASLVAGND